MDDDAIRVLVKRLARPHPSGGSVVERAAILAEGAGFTEVISWITDHDGVPEESVSGAPSLGLHGARSGARGPTPDRAAARFVLPAEAFASKS